jgi:hypothetical protein
MVTPQSANLAHPPEPAIVIGTMTDSLPWAKPFRRRCRRRLTPAQSLALGNLGYWGRCDLQRDHALLGFHNCALERGMDVVRF